MLYPKLTLALLPIISLIYLDFYINYKKPRVYCIKIFKLPNSYVILKWLNLSAEVSVLLWRGGHGPALHPPPGQWDRPGAGALRHQGHQHTQDRKR